MASSFLRSGLGRLVLGLMLITLVPALAVMLYLGSAARGQAFERAAAEQKKAAAAAARLFEEMFATVGQALEYAADDAGESVGAQQCVRRVAKLAASHPFILRALAVARDGRVLCTNEGIPPAPIDLSDRPAFRRALRTGGIATGAPVVSRLTGEVVLPVAIGVPADPSAGATPSGHERPAVLMVSLDLAWFARLIRDMSDLAPLEPAALILSENSQILAAAPAVPRLPPEDDPSRHPLVRAVLSAPSGWARVTDFEGRVRLVGFAHAYSTGLAFAISVDHDALVWPIIREFLIALGLLGTAACLGLGLAIAIAHARIGRPLLALAEAAEAIGNGAKARVPWHRTVGEIALVIQSFNRMVEEITKRQGALESANRELESANRQLTDLAEQDALTGLANRRAFDRRLEAAWKHGQRHARPVGLLILDLDHFKQFNDRYGHLEGDACLIRVARQLKAVQLRPQDLPARLGGEEFAVLLPETDLAGAIAVGERIRAALHEMMLLHEGSPHGIVTASIGAAAMVPPDISDPRALLAAADRALYAAKAEGRDRVSAAGLAEAA